MSAAVVPLVTPVAPSATGPRAPVGSAPLDWPPPRPRTPRGAKRRARNQERARQKRLEEARRRKLLPVAVRLVQAMRALRPLRASLTLSEGEVLSDLKDLNRFEDLGYVRFSDFAAEALRRNPRTARRRIALHRVLGETPALREPYLAGKIGVSQALALEPVVTQENAPMWIRLAERLPHARLVELVQRARGRKAASDPDSQADPNHDAENAPSEATYRDAEDVTRRRIHILSPQSAGFAIEHGLETAQRILGWDAPRDACLNAILSEATPNLGLPGLSGDVPGSTPQGTGDRPQKENPLSSTARAAADDDPVPSETSSPSSCRSHDDSVFYHRNDLKRARRVLNRAEHTLRRLHRLVDQDSAPPRKTLSAVSLLARYQAITRARNPLRALEARLVYCFFTLRVGALLQCEDDLADCARLLGVTERTVRNLGSSGCAFEHCHALADAFIQGKIGFTQVLMLHGKEAWPVRDWVRRAKVVTQRQLRRELRLGFRLQWALPFAPRGVPTVELESQLQRQLFDRGWTPKDLDAELGSRGLVCPPCASKDPAENPVVLARLETLTDLLILDACSHEDARSARGSLPRKTLSVPGRHVAVVIWARPEIWDHWHEALGCIHRTGAELPPWAVATLLVKAALDEWERIDPDRIPTEARILERDDYRCRAPGCSSRRHLEVHHIIFRSHGGSDDPENLVTLCHQHHHHAVHRGTLLVTGQAPYALTWEFGAVRYEGERRNTQKSRKPKKISISLHLFG